MDLLLQHKAFVNAKNKAGVTPAHLAAERGATEIVELLVEKYKASTDVLSMVRFLECSCWFMSPCYVTKMNTKTFRPQGFVFFASFTDC